MSQEQIQAINAGGPVVQVLIPGFQGPRGLNAYEHALALGYTGSLADWLVSLTGPAGLTGPKGEDGANFLLFEIDGLSAPIFPASAVGGQAGYAAAIDTFYVCTETGTPGVWQESSTIAGSVFNVYKPLVDAAGPLTDRGAYDSEPVGFPYLGTDTQAVYVRQGAPGGWSDGIPFRGPAGSTVRSSVGPPSFLDGADGDYNIDYLNWDIYGPKAAGAWGSPYSLDYPATVAQAAADAAQAAADAAQAAADAAQATADAAVPLAGGTMTGGLVIPSLNGGPLAGFRNKIMNGAMNVTNKGVGIQLSGTTYGHAIDRWVVAKNGLNHVVNCNHSSSYGPATVGIAGFRAFLRSLTAAAKTATAAGDVYYLAQTLEAGDTIDLEYGYASAKPVTLTFRVRASVAGTYSGSLRQKNAAVSVFRAYCFNYTITDADVWQTISVTIPGDPSGFIFDLDDLTIGNLSVNFDLGTGTTYRTATANAWIDGNFVGVTGSVDLSTVLNSTFDITGVQLEIGTVATPLEFRPQQVELELCQRYFQWVQVQLYFIAPTGSHYIEMPHTLVTEMRAAPTAGTLANGEGVTGTTSNLLAYSAIRLTRTSVSLTMTSGGLGAVYMVGFRYPLSAEI